MTDITSAITDAQREFIDRQPLVFIATAAGAGPIDLNPAAMADFRVLGPNLVAYLSGAGPDDEAQAQITVMACTVDQPSSILRLHGRGRVVQPEDDEWDIVSRVFGHRAGSRRIVLVAVETVRESAGWTPLREEQTPAPVEIAPDWVPAVLNFWLNEVGPAGWFDSSEEEDVRLTHLFRALWEAQRDKPAEDFLTDGDTALAALILFDQFPRNMFRGQARAFATDALALEIARGALERGFDDGFVEGARAFFYLPFMHSENLADQERSVALFSQPGYEMNLQFAIAHRDIVARFGRFPHRNAVLGRQTLPDEEEAVAEGSAW